MSTDFSTNNTPTGAPPILGTYYHVCPGSSTIINTEGTQIVGSSGNSGLDSLHPLDSIVTAYGKCKSGAGDGIVIWGFGTATSMNTSYLTSTLTFAKSGITVVGMGQGTQQSTSSRARISNKSTALTLSPLLVISGNDNAFFNISLFNSGTSASALGTLQVSGSRNYFERCHIASAGDTTPAQTTGMYALQIYGGRENTFRACTIGLDTVDMGGNALANGILRFTGTSGGATQDPTRNDFIDCQFLTYYSYASANSGVIKIEGSGDGITRTQVFKNCSLINYKTGTISTTPPAAVVIGTLPNNGSILFQNCTVVGYTAVGPASAASHVLSDKPAATAGGPIAVTDAS